MTIHRIRRIGLEAGARLFLILFTLTVLIGPVAAFGATETPTELTSGVLYAPERGSIFVMLPGGGIAEVELATGSERWRTTAAAKPLLIHQGRLLAQADGKSDKLRLRSFDLSDLKTAPVGIEYDLPGDVTASIDDEMLLAFRARAVVKGGDPYVIWSYKRNSSRLQPSYADQVDTNGKGAIRIDMNRRTAVSADLAKLRSGIERSSFQPGGLASAIRPAGNAFAGLELVGKPGQERQAVLKRWRKSDEKPLDDVALESSDVRRWVFSADNRHVMLGSLRADAGPEERYAWTVYSMKSGERLVEIARPKSGAPYIAHDSTLLYVSAPMRKRVGDELVEVPLSIEAVGIDNGKSAWSQAVRDTAYRGPYPKELPERTGPSGQLGRDGRAMRK